MAVGISLRTAPRQARICRATFGSNFAMKPRMAAVGSTRGKRGSGLGRLIGFRPHAVDDLADHGGTWNGPPGAAVQAVAAIVAEHEIAAGWNVYGLHRTGIVAADVDIAREWSAPWRKSCFGTAKAPKAGPWGRGSAYRVD